jgi:hypothetical protein
MFEQVRPHHARALTRRCRPGRDGGAGRAAPSFAAAGRRAVSTILAPANLLRHLLFCSESSFCRAAQRATVYCPSRL